MRASSPFFQCLAFAVVSCALTSGAAYAATDAIDFDRQVRPILSDNCYKCHGPDAKARKADLRLDSKDSAFRTKNGKTVIAPGKSGYSELVRRITSLDPEEVMPPPKSNRKLTGNQIATLRTWVDQGARWGMHWSFLPLKRSPVPPTQRDSWCRNGVDAFMLQRLRDEGLKPSSEAPREALLRRVTLDLTGLPPTLKELDDFLNDSSPDAYQKVVERLLASPRYGERMATIWLDLARFADTHGYQMDRYRAMWPYRDWVIKAFNENLPYDQFVTWQLAGDLLPHATKEQRLATAFNRLHMQNEEGGIVEEEFRVAYVVDRVDTFGTAFLGLTFECSRCHDHKFDPITQKDFYSLFAFFQNIDESGQTTFFTSSVPVPTLLLSDDATDRKLADLRRDIANEDKELDMLGMSAPPVELLESFEHWLVSKAELPKFSGCVGEFHFGQLKDNKVTNASDPSKPGSAVEGPTLVEGKFGKAALLSGENGFTFPGIGHFTRADPFSLALWLKTPSHAPRMTVVHHSKAPIDAGSRGYELLLEDGKVAFGLHHMWPGNSLKVRTKPAVPLNAWTHVAVTYDGSSRASGIRIYIDGKPAECEIIRDGLYKDITYSRDGGEPDLAIGYRFRDNGFKDGQVDDFRIFDRALVPAEAAELAGRSDLAGAWNAAPADLSATQRQLLLEYFRFRVYQPTRKLLTKLQDLRTQENRLVDPIPEVMVMQEMPQPKPAYILKRGAYDAHGEQVWSNTPAVLPPMLKGEPRNRLGLAHWLFSPDNPLTARVAANRLWQQMFGKGIVETSDNFGSQGSPPTHPELLDHLACDLRDGGWDVKKLLKEIAMSATYRQASRAGEELLAKDPDDKLLSRGPARRLTAEMLRDQSLLDSGLLVEKLGGPSVRPYQPEGVWDVAMGHPTYDQGHGDDLHRRSLYTFWKRSVPPPAMLAFDAADRNYCVARRQSTSTPLQALALLNDVQMTEAARMLAERMLKEGRDTIDHRIAWMFRLVTDRNPTAKELPILKQLFLEQRESFATEPDSVKKLLAVGEAKNDPSLDPLDLAAGTVLGEAVLNHDDAVMRR